MPKRVFWFQALSGRKCQIAWLQKRKLRRAIDHSPHVFKKNLMYPFPKMWAIFFTFSSYMLFQRTNLRYCSIIFRTRYFDERTFSTALLSFELVILTNEPSLLLYHLSNSLFQRTNLRYCFIIFLNSLFRQNRKLENTGKGIFRNTLTVTALVPLLLELK